MPRAYYRGKVRSDLYTTMYEQYYFGNNAVQQVKTVYPVRKLKPVEHITRLTPVKKQKKSGLKTFALFILMCILLFCVCPYSYQHFVDDIIQPGGKTVLKADYRNLLYPTHSYLYKNLFAGKYIVKDTDYKTGEMVDIQENTEKLRLKNSLMNLAGEYTKIKPAVYVWEYNTKNYVDIDADEIYPAASIIKIPVLIEMFRQIEKGKYSLRDYMTLEDYYRSPGSGKLQYARGGVNYSIDYLAEIMIENSDNSATNMLMAKSGGMPEVNRALKKWGLKKTSINNWLPDLDGTNVTTAREMAKMLYNLNSSNILSDESKERAFYYLSHVKNNRLLQAGIPKEARLFHKTGDIGHMLGDAGIVLTHSGKKYIVVILVKRPYNNRQGKDFIVKASKLIYENIANQ